MEHPDLWGWWSQRRIWQAPLLSFPCLLSLDHTLCPIVFFQDCLLFSTSIRSDHFFGLHFLRRFLCHVQFMLNEFACFSFVNLPFVIGLSAMNLGWMG
jgi:hypothetical protein